MFIDKTVIGKLNKKMKHLVEYLENSHTDVSAYRECKIGGRNYIDIFWVPLVEIGQDTMIRVYGTYYEILTMDPGEGWVTVGVYGSEALLYDGLIHLG